MLKYYMSIYPDMKKASDLGDDEVTKFMEEVCK
jgi:hypothetical protein